MRSTVVYIGVNSKGEEPEMTATAAQIAFIEKLAEVVAEATRKDTPAEMREVARAAHDLEGAIAAAATARDSRDQAVRAARAAGHGPAKIAEAAGLSMAGYYKIVGAGS